VTRPPRRIVCLTEETTETLYLLGEADRIVGVSAYTMRPAEARLKPRVSSFIDANFDRILELRPDLVLGFSDLQADIAAELIRRGVAVLTFNQRTVGEILDTIQMIGGLVGRGTEAAALVDRLTRGLEDIRAAAADFPRRPRVFFEEWDDPLISCIRWVHDLVEIAGGQPIFPELASGRLAKERFVDPAEVVRRDPEVIFASWCGKRLRKDVVRRRPGWETVAAVRHDRIHEIPSVTILQPGPASLTDGVARIHAHLRQAAASVADA